MFASTFVEIVEKAGCTWRKQEQEKSLRQASGIWISLSIGETFFSLTQIRQMRSGQLEQILSKLGVMADFDRDWKDLPGGSV